jgi:NAD(P)-dependent dehydrogenase (short-subunit alcohol dehydrogenase family)
MATILITGTTRGLGRFLRERLTATGHTVYGSGRTAVSADERHLALDVRDAASADLAVKTVLEREGRLDALINNAGSHLLGAAIETSEAELRDQLELNFFGAVNMMRAVVPHFLERRAGRVINISSVGGRFATPFASAYAASKFALEGYTEALRLELLPFGVFVSNLSPGFLATGTTKTSVVPVKTEDPRFAAARREVFERMLIDGAAGTPLSKVAQVVEGILSAKRPRLRYSVDGLATRLTLARLMSPSATFEHLVTKQTAPGLLALSLGVGRSRGS